MIKSQYFPDHSFKSKADLFAMLKKHEDNIIEFKKAHIYKGFEKSLCFGNADNILHKTDASKANIGFEAKEGYIYPIVSTTRYMDSHDDVHFDGCFGKTVKDQQGKVYYCADHDLSLKGIVTNKKDIEMFTASIPWQFVGKSYTGNTEGLVMAFKKDAIKNQQAKDIIDSDEDLENSIRMVYVKIVMGIDSTDKQYKVNKDYFDSRVNDIANKERAEDLGYFFGVEELKIHKEASLVVGGGSNDATRIYQYKTTEAVTDTTAKIEPPAGTQTDINKILQNIKF
jgi:hypothetical protein